MAFQLSYTDKHGQTHLQAYHKLIDYDDHDSRLMLIYGVWHDRAARNANHEPYEVFHVHVPSGNPGFTVGALNTAGMNPRRAAYLWLKANHPPLSGAIDV